MSESKVPPSAELPDGPTNENRPPDEDPAVDVAHEVTDEKSDQAADESERLIELQQAQARALRAQAELENFRKRVRREMDEERKYSQLPLLRDLLAVIDNFDLAMDALEPSENSQGLLQGVKMVGEQLVSVLQQHHCSRIDAESMAFDPNLHEAIAQEANDTIPKGNVIRVAKSGYRLHDRVIRPALVVVSTGAANDGDGATAAVPTKHEEGVRDES